MSAAERFAASRRCAEGGYALLGSAASRAGALARVCRYRYTGVARRCAVYRIRGCVFEAQLAASALPAARRGGRGVPPT